MYVCMFVIIENIEILFSFNMHCHLYICLCTIKRRLYILIICKYISVIPVVFKLSRINSQHIYVYENTLKKCKFNSLKVLKLYMNYICAYISTYITIYLYI